MTEWNVCPQCGSKLEDRPNNEDVTRPTCPNGHFVHYENPTPAVAGLVEYEGTYLVLRRGYAPKQGCWDLPGGYMEATEQPDEALRRELREETGLTVADVELLGAFNAPFGDNPDDLRNVLGIYFTCRTDSDRVTLSAENPEYRWVTLAEFPETASAADARAVAELKRRAG